MLTSTDSKYIPLVRITDWSALKKYSLRTFDYANIYNYSGSRPSSSSILTEVQKLLKAEDDLQEKKAQLSQTEQQLEAVQQVATKWVPACMFLYVTVHVQYVHMSA